MKLARRYNDARGIAEILIDRGSYVWRPSCAAGWLIRIACTDVGQDAWQRAADPSALSVLRGLVELEHSSGTDLAPEPDQPVPLPNPSEQ